jgi:hypothetical protein
MNNVNMHSNLPPRNLDETTLTKREHFAAMAMQGLIANSDWLKNIIKLCEGDDVRVYGIIKATSHSLADTMLEDK